MSDIKNTKRSFKGKARLDKKTKNLVTRLQPGDIAIIDHLDVDRVCAESLVERKPAAVINANQVLSGRYPAAGASILKEASIHLIDNVDDEIFGAVREGDELTVVGTAIYKNGELLFEGREIDIKFINGQLEKARTFINKEIEKFAINTLDFIHQEKAHVLDELDVPACKTGFKGRHALIVVRGHDYKKDFKVLSSYIREVRPVFVAVDGGADLLLEYGYKPDIVVGDMDSVSDEALEKAKELVLHAYPDGRAPGGDRLENLGLEYSIFSASATSEDLALLLAYEHGAELITAIGTHSNLEDFLDKGREGMASTFLTRLKIGSKFVDARGVSKLYKGTVKTSYMVLLIMAGLATISIIILVSPPIRQVLKLAMIRLSFSLGL